MLTFKVLSAEELFILVKINGQKVITIFSIPKPFQSKISVIQKNAISSWKLLHPEAQVVLYGNEIGIESICKSLSVEHVPNIALNQFGTPYLAGIFDDIKKRAKHEIIIYSNCDIILMDDIIKLINQVLNKINSADFLIGGRRIDVEIESEINFSKSSWRDELKSFAQENGILHGYAGIDYFIFPKLLPIQLLNFTVGRPGWDNWFIYSALSNKIKVFDATYRITALHQNHSRAYNGIDKDSIYNISLIGNFSDLATLYNADYIFTKVGIKRAPILRRTITKISFTWPFNELLSFKRKLTKKLVHYIL